MSQDGTQCAQATQQDPVGVNALASLLAIVASLALARARRLDLFTSRSR